MQVELNADYLCFSQFLCGGDLFHLQDTIAEWATHPGIVGVSNVPNPRHNLINTASQASPDNCPISATFAKYATRSVDFRTHPPIRAFYASRPVERQRRHRPSRSLSYRLMLVGMLTHRDSPPREQTLQFDATLDLMLSAYAPISSGGLRSR